jgi:hypothetical protein
MVGMTSLALTHQNFTIVTRHNSENTLYKLLNSGRKDAFLNTATMPVSLLTLPYELREHILTTLLSHNSNIRLQHPIENRTVFTSPITQVCKPLREEAIRIFYQTNAFTWTIDPEAVSPDLPYLSKPIDIPKDRFLISSTPTQTELPDPTSHPSSPTDNKSKNHHSTTNHLASPIPQLNPAHLRSIRHLRLNLSLPNPYSRKTWQTTFATQLANFVNAIDNGHRLKDFKVLISSWHYFREVCDWQTDVLVEGLGKLEVKGDVQVRGRGFDVGVREELGEVRLSGMMMREGATRRICGREGSGLSFGVAGESVDWEWEGGVVL